MSLLAAHGALIAGGDVLSRWNPADKAAELMLSGGNQVCTRSSASNNTWRSVRSVTSHNSGKRFAQCRVDANGAVNGSMMFGVGTAAAGINNTPGSGPTSWGTQANNSPTVLTRHNGVIRNTGAAVVGVGESAIVGVDFDAGMIWFGDTVAGWYGSGNPATGTNPHYTFTPNSELFLMLGQYSSPVKSTLFNHDGEAAAWLPAGFEMWG